VDYAGCYIKKGTLKLRNPSRDFFPGYVAMGMNAMTREVSVQIQGHVGDYLGYRSPRIDIEVEGTVRDRVVAAVGDGSLKVVGDIIGGLGGGSQSLRVHVDGSIGRVNPNNQSCTILVAEDIQWGIGENQSDCFIKVCGSVGMKFKKSGKLQDIAAGLSKNSTLLVGGDIYGNVGRDMELAKVYIWGKIHGDIQASDTEGGFIYCNKRSTPIFKRLKKSIGGDIGIQYVTLKDSGYLFAEEPADLQEIIV
jgi:formylmethanofuran dehydrogenase subunit C